MPIALRSDSCPDFFTCDRRHILDGSYETPHAFDVPLHKTDSQGADSRHLSTACSSGETKGELDEGLDKGSTSRLQEECDEYFRQEMSSERQQADDLDAVASPTSTSTWSPATNTAETSLAPSPRLHPKDNNLVQESDEHQLLSPSSIDQDPLSEETFLLELERSLAAYQQQQPPQETPPAPHLSCALARRNAYLLQSRLRSDRAYYSPSHLRPSDIIPPLTRFDTICHQPNGYFTVTRYGKLKPNRLRDWLDRVFVHKVAVRLGCREEGGWEGVVRDMAEGMRRMELEKRRAERRTFGVWCSDAVAWSGYMLGKWEGYLYGDGKGVADWFREGKRIDGGL